MRSGETVEEAIIRLYTSEKPKYSKFKIRKMIGCGGVRIDNAIKEFEIFQSIPSPKKRGRPTKANEEVLSIISEKTTNDPTITGSKISEYLLTAENIKISATTINEYRKKLNFNYQMPKIRQELSTENIQKRYIFANSVLANKIDLSKIIFSDESRFCLLNDGQMLWLRKGGKYDDIFIEKAKYNPGIMVYGAIGKDYKSELVICDNSITDIEYRNIIEKSKMFE